MSGLPVSVRALLTACLATATATLACAQIPAATLAEANAELQAGEADKAIALLPRAIHPATVGPGRERVPDGNHP